ncbi:MAG: PIG-L family deacetylase [Alphaproteobacteria bacterium]|nr:PIG-L family deacetylase [Alphaproteobacteria bacterium]
MKPTNFYQIKTAFTAIVRLAKRLVTAPKVIVSLTSYPPRINGLQPMLETLFSQTKQPDKIILWLAVSEFPNKEADLPQYLTQLATQKKIVIEWCDNLKPHKKYFYALQKYRDDIVITVDDDLLFEPDLIECLLVSYHQFPRAISVMRSHIMHPRGTKFADYACFTQQQNEIIGIPCMRLLGTNGAGSLFPPRLLDWRYFNEEAIKNLSLNTDDLWLKTIEVLSGVPVVQPRPFNGLKYVENSQNIALFYENTQAGGNDINLENIRKWVDVQFGEGYFLRQIFANQPLYKSRRKLIRRKTLLYFVPHQDDELLTMGIDINTAAAKGEDVHVILCTDGRKSGVRQLLNNGQSCELHRETHRYALSEAEFIRARDAEFIDSCRLLGVPPENIHIPAERGVDGQLDLVTAETIIRRYVGQYGKKAIVNAIYFDNGEMQHKDHKTLGKAVYNLWQQGLFHKVKFFKEPYCKAADNISFVCRLALPETVPCVCSAAYNYGYWAPEEGRYAIGYHSVPHDFADLRREMKMYSFKLQR